MVYDTNDVVVNELWHKTKDLDNYYKSIFQPFIVSASVLVESLMDPNSQSQDILVIDINEIKLGQFRKLYYVLISYFVVLSYFTNPFLKDDLKNGLFKVTENSDFVKNFLNRSSCSEK